MRKALGLAMMSAVAFLLLVAAPQNGQQPKDDGCSGPGCSYNGCPKRNHAVCKTFCEQKADGIHCHQECTCERD